MGGGAVTGYMQHLRVIGRQYESSVNTGRNWSDVAAKVMVINQTAEMIPNFPRTIQGGSCTRFECSYLITGDILILAYAYI
jgi:hypothetical protein